MNRETIILWRNILLRSCLIGVLFALVLFGATLGFWNTAVGWMFHLFHVDEKTLGAIVLQFFTNVRLIVLFLFLAPALALHWTAAKMR